MSTRHTSSAAVNARVYILYTEELNPSDPDSPAMGEITRRRVVHVGWVGQIGVSPPPHPFGVRPPRCEDREHGDS